MRHFLFILAILVLGHFGHSQEVVEGTNSFTLEEAIAFALENNYSAINADRDVIDARKQKWEVIASGLPQVSGAVGYQNQLKQPVSVIPAEIFGGEPGTFEEVVFGQPQQMTATATLRQQIFDGSYIVGVQATKSFLSYSANNQEKTDLEVRKAVTEAYGNVLLAEESIAILEKNKINLEKNLFETRKLFENGLGDEESVEQLQITTSNIDNQLKNAIRLSDITRRLLNLVMGIDIDAPTKLEQNLDQLVLLQTDLDLLDAELNIENNVDYKLALNLNEQRFFEWKLAKSKALPSLNTFINYGTSAFADNFNFFNGDQQWFDSSIWGVDLTIPIFSSGLRGAGTKRAKLALEKAKTQLSEAEQQIRLQTKRAKSDYTLAIEQYETAKDNLSLAERIENKNQIKYSEGLASSFELRQAQTQLYDAQQGYLQSMVEVINKKTELETILNN
ncbi:TolC family protein [Aggregatimonas sangjinii]|uniref:TolC family protein n=1 Tax=Aggregatimonas sangjinii TaxID=2583587 RepID=A0A5B7SXQ4_9FLAO|nr:TolC family protein [Aggregatimonas sangjinii]QCX01671.1 TolC family protein [Aggregatimonas sangjinii]